MNDERNNKIIFDIKLIPYNQIDHEKNEYFQNYSFELIKSGCNFKTKDLFKINNNIIEGVLYKNEEIITFFNSKRNGIYYEFYKFILKIDIKNEQYNKQEISSHTLLKNKYYYVNDKIEGKYENYYNNGNKKNECNYISGKKEGIYKEWDYNGNKKIKTFYKDDKYEGNFIEWFSNGEIYINCYFKNNKKEGKYEKWNKYGDKIVECYYNNDQLNGLYKEWYSNGKIKFESFYHNDKSIN
jgi:hypothetical protein